MNMFHYSLVSVLVFLLGAANTKVLRHQHTHHHKFTKRELAQVFGADSNQQVPDYEIAKLNRVGNIPVSIKLAAFGTEMRLNLTLGQDFISKSHTIEFYGANGKVEKFRGTPGEFSSGTVHREEGSHVALHHNDNGASGAVRTKKDMFFISPLPRRMQTSEGDHVLYRRTDLTANHILSHFGCGTKEPISKNENKEKKRSTFHRRSKRSTTQAAKTMEVMIAGDYKMVAHYSKLFLPTYMLAAANIMSGLFKDPSLEYPIDVFVTRTVIFEEDLFKAATITDLLASFTDWVKMNNNPDDNESSHVDSALLMTRDGCEDGCKLEGYATVSSICKANAQSVSKDRGLMTSLTMAHELAHNLGVSHDNSEECPDGKNIMATGTADSRTVFHWSKCSSDKIKEIMLSDATTCLNDVPTTHMSNVSFQLYGEVYDATKQCEFIFSDGYKKCQYKESTCSQLFCEEIGASKCIALSYPPVHGTSCGEHLHCIQGQCVPDGTTASGPIDGGWSDWSNYTLCNRDCGVGVQWKTRQCNNPAPSDDGKSCVGEKIGYFKTCNTQPCPKDVPEFRLQQCRDLNPENKDFYDDSKPCHLICGSTSSAYYFGLVKDGTQCTPNVNGEVNNICIQGTCKKIGCDLELESGNVIDRCGVCKGSGNTCELVTGEDYNIYGALGEYKLADVPVGTTRMKFKEVGATLNFIGFKVGDSKDLAFYIPTYSTSYELDGVVISYLMEGHYYPDQLTAEKALPKKISTYLVNRYQRKSEGVVWSYYQPASNNTDQNVVPLKLIAGGWESCSKSCGGGSQVRPLYCKRGDDDSEVSIELCKDVEGPISTQSCNLFACPAEWHVTDWTTCSKPCGTGTQSRQLFCSRIDGTGKLVTVDNSECSQDIPGVTTSQKCNKLSCPAQWNYGEWSDCSKSCGVGTRTRSSVCKHINSEGVLQSINALACQYLGDPFIQEECNADIQCPLWKVEYSKCSVTCGGGTQSPTVSCVDPNTGLKVKNENQCSTTTKPSVKTRACNEQTCNLYVWKDVEGVCSVTCGAGLKPVKVVCYGQSEKTGVDEAKCTAPKPQTPEPVQCNAGSCPEVYEWKNIYSQCSVTCGEGIKVTVPYCQRVSDKKEVNRTFCDPSTKPATETEPCVLSKACPIKYAWKIEYTDCSVTCGSGTLNSVIKCLREKDDVEVDTKLCKPSKKPAAESKSCSMNDCPLKTIWKYKNSSCSVSCGQGVITSLAVCVRASDEQVMSDDDCDASTKFADRSYTCVEAPCLSKFYWKVTYGDCVAKCGSGYKLKIVDCIERDNGFVVSSEKCKGLSTPPPDETCESKPCKPVFSTDKMPPSYAVGCYKDIPTPRRVPIYLENFRALYNQNDSSVLVKRCAEQAHAMGYVYFSVQYHGECWAGDANTADSYYLNGYSANCNDGIGGAAANFVYKIGSPEVIKSVPAIMKMGCYEDDLEVPRPMSSMTDNFRPILDWDKMNFAEIINMCARSTDRRGNKLFALQYYGECWSGEDAGTLKTYNRAGNSDRCKDGVGHLNANYVYMFLED